MSATVLILILITGGAIAFFLRFLAALYKETRGARTQHVTMRSGVKMYSRREHGNFEPPASALVRLDHRIDDSHRLQDRLVRDSQAHPRVAHTDSESWVPNNDPEVRIQPSSFNLRVPRGGIYG
jgi:hypothetical protein